MLEGDDGCRDLQTGTQLAAFKDNASGINSISLIGNDYFAAAQTSKDALHFWTWHKVSPQGFALSFVTYNA